MPANSALGRDIIPNTVDGFQNSRGQIWDEQRGIWRNPDGSQAPIQPRSPEGSQNPNAPSKTDQLLGIAAPIVGVAAGRAGASRLASALGVGGEQAANVAPPTLLGATRVPSVAGSAAPSATAATGGSPSVAAPELLGATRAPAAASSGLFASSPIGQLAGGNFGLAPILGTAAGIGGAIGGFDLLANSQAGNQVGSTLQGAASGAGIGTSILPGPGTAIGAAIGGAVGLAKSFEGGKSSDQKGRDDVRNFLEKQGVAFKPEGSGSHHIRLADGSTYDIGQDGRAEFTSFDGSKQIRSGYETDDTNPLHEDASRMGVAAFTTATGLLPDDKGFNGVASIINGIMSNADGNPEIAQANARKFLEDAGIDQAEAFKRIGHLLDTEQIDIDQARIHQMGINQIFGEDFISEPRPVTKAAAEDIAVGLV